MPNDNGENSESFLKLLKSKDKLILIIFITLIIIMILLLYLVEKIIFNLLTLITFTSIISIPLQIILHILLIRYIILEVAFSGQNLIISRSIFYNYGRIQANYLYSLLMSFHESLCVFNDIRGLVISLKELNALARQIDTVNYMINGYLDIFNKIKNKFNK